MREDIIQALKAKGRKSRTFKTPIKGLIEYRIDDDKFIDFCEDTIEINKVQIKVNALGKELLYINGVYNTMYVESAAEEEIIRNI